MCFSSEPRSEITVLPNSTLRHLMSSNNPVDQQQREWVAQMKYLSYITIYGLLRRQIWNLHICKL